MIVETFKNRFLRYFLTLFGLTSVLLLSVPFANAAEQGYGSFWYGPNNQTVSGVSYLKTGVVSSNKYDAALYALGFGTSTVSGISNSKKNSLKANSTFSSFANKFVTGKPDDDLTTIIPGLPTVGLNMNSMLSAWYAARAMYGESNCYWSVYSSDAADSAEDAAYQIIKGGTSSGGGSGSSNPSIDTDGWYKVTLDAVLEPYSGNQADKTITVYDNPTTVKLDSSGKGTVSGGSVGSPITWNNCKKIIAYIDPYSFNLLNSLGFENIRYIRSFETTYCILSEYDYEFYKSGGSDSNYYITNTSENENHFAQYNSSKSTVYRINNNICIFFTSVSKNSNWSLVKDGNYTSPKKPFWYNDKVTDPVEPDPPTDWPDPTPTPTPPDPPDPVTPEPPNPWIPIPDEDIDITGEDFQDLIDALNEHCIHLQNSISSNISQLWSLQSDLFSDHMNAFWDNLHNDILWLGECLNFDVNVNVDAGGGGGDGGSDGGGDGENNTYVPFDDSSVIYWLKQIWSKLGNGISVEPVDPLTQSDDWWAWLLSLMRDFVALLLGFGAGSLSAVTSGLQSLTSKFPFSLPWDLVAMFALLDAPPVVPAFDLPCYAVTGSGISQVGTYHITLEAFDDVWEGVRWVERIGFAVMLIRSTDMVTGLMRKAVGRD